MNTTASNTSVRERRRRSNPQTIEQMDILKALTAAEYSRRQFVLNYAASRDTRLLVPGKKADVIKQAEEWVVQWMNTNGYGTISNDHFKYTVDERLWNDLVGADIPFPFSFMRVGLPQVVSSPETMVQDPYPLEPVHEVTNGDGNFAPTTTKKRRSKSDAFLPDAISVPALTTVEVRLLEDGQPQISTTTSNGNATGKATSGDGRLSRQTTNTSTTTSNYTGTQLSSAVPTNSNTTQSSTQPRRGSLMNGLTSSSSTTKKERKKSLSSATPAPAQTNGMPGPANDISNKNKKNLQGAVSGPMVLERKRSMSLTSLETDDLKMGRRASVATQERFPFLVRWSRSWGRRTSA